MLIETAPDAKKRSRLLPLTTSLAALLATGLVAGCGSSSSKSSADTSASPSATASSSDSGSSSTPTSADFAAVLLTDEEVGTTAQGTFTGTPSADDSADTTATGCAALDDFTKESKGTETARAGRDYATADQSINVSEEILTAPKAEPLFTALKGAISSCDSFTVAGSALTLKTLDDPAIDGSDDTFAAEAIGSVQGSDVSVDLYGARFGEKVLSVTFVSGSADGQTVAQQLLEQAATKAKDVLQ